MKSWLLQNLHNIRYSYWFIPSVMCLMAAILAVGLVAIDLFIMKDIPQSLLWLLTSDPDGARSLLSSVASSTITVAGVVFSMTLMSLSHATSNYGSRLLQNFLKDIRNQVALGTFMATFIYCLLILRTVSGSNAGDTDIFVPHIAVLGGLVMALLSVVVLISFIHHVPDQIDIGTLSAERGKELVKRLEKVFPSTTGHDTLAVPSFSGKHCVPSPEPGYLQNLDLTGLANFCEKKNIRAKLLCEPGDFLLPNESILIYENNNHGNTDTQVDIDESSMQRFFAMGSERTPSQDVRFYVEELQQACIRSLSPGINDPFTATTCLDWLAMAVATILNKEACANTTRSETGVVRVIQRPFDKQRFIDNVFAPLSQHLVSDFVVIKVCLNLLFRLQNLCVDPVLKSAITKHSEHLYRQAISNQHRQFETARIENLWHTLQKQS